MRTSLLFSLATLTLAFQLPAAVVVEYPFPPSVSTGASVVHDPRLSASNAAWVGVSPTHGFGGSYGNAYINSSTDNRAIREFSADKYLTFTLEADEGFTLKLDALHFELGGTAQATGVTVYTEVRTSVDGFASSLLLDGGGSVASRVIAPETSAPVYSPFSISLGEGFEALETITFRLHIYMETNVSNTYLRLDNFVLEGSVAAIPEPSPALWLLGGGAGFLFLFGRRHHRRG